MSGAHHGAVGCRSAGGCRNQNFTLVQNGANSQKKAPVRFMRCVDNAVTSKVSKSHVAGKVLSCSATLLALGSAAAAGSRLVTSEVSCWIRQGFGKADLDLVRTSASMHVNSNTQSRTIY